ncbi:MAG: radical SAM protein [Christensenellaceae bacterium]
MDICTLCPVECRADRDRVVGRCRSKSTLRIARAALHPYEEPCISFRKGSGAIFFCGCNLQCRFCQNYELSRVERGREISVEELAEIFRSLEEAGADNINLVTPTHYITKIAEAFRLYRPGIPVVYNTSSYEKVESLRLIAPYVDIWLPDLKFCSPKVSLRYTGREDYFLRAKEAISFMAETPLTFSEEGKMLSGTIVRHLILPLNVADSMAILDELAPVKDKIFLSLMRQYTPFGDVDDLPELKRPITSREYRRVLDHAKELGFTNLFLQDKSSSDTAYIPQWED